MGLPLQMVCSECGRSVTWSGDALVGEPSPCRVCEAKLGDESADFQLGQALLATPPSLQLTPDEAGTCDWGREGDRAAPATIGRFQVRELLGGGGFGHVYRAFDSRLERDVALKVLRDANPPARVIERFFREARAAAQLDHPNIVSLHDAGRDAGRCWIAYQYVAGTTLGKHRDERGRDHRNSARIVRDLADALDHAHLRGVYHRDLKPANILVDLLGRPRLTDFGLARRVDFDATMTRDGAILGTAQYMSPEQASGNSHSADGRSDLYSLGVVFHELLCGRRPLDLPTTAPAWKTMSRKKTATPSLRVRDRSVPRALDRICIHALAHDPDDRYPDARAMADDLDDWLSSKQSGWVRPVMVATLLVTAVLAREAVALAAWPWSGPVVASSDPPKRVDALKPQAVIAAIRRPARDEIAAERLVGNGTSMTLHLDDCHAVSQMSPTRQVRFESLKDAISRGFKPCKSCLKSKLPGRVNG